MSRIASSTQFPEVKNTVDVNNSTSVTLAADTGGSDHIFTGAATPVLDFVEARVAIFTDVASATDGLEIQYSIDGTNWDHVDEYTVPAMAPKKGKTYQVQRVGSFYRLVYTNGLVVQAAFRMATILNATHSQASSHNIRNAISSDDDAELVKAVLTGEDPSGIFMNVKTNREAALSVTDFLFEVARQSITGIKMFSIPGRKDALSSSALDDLTQIPGTIVVPEPGGIQLEVVSDSASDTSAGTGIQTVDIHYLDTSGVEQEETVILAGLTPVDTVATDIDFVQWVHAKSVGSVGVSVGNISLRDTAGVITYDYISAGGNQSLSAKYKVPTGKTGYVVGWQASGITKKIDIRLRATVERFDRALIPGVFLFQDIVVLNDTTSGWIPFMVPLMMPAGAIIKLSGISSAAGGDAAGQFDIMLVDD